MNNIQCIIRSQQEGKLQRLIIQLHFHTTFQDFHTLSERQTIYQNARLHPTKSNPLPLTTGNDSTLMAELKHGSSMIHVNI